MNTLVYLNSKTKPAVVLRAALDTRVVVDRVAGTIKDIAVMTAGTAYPANFDPFEVDAVTLRQTADAINAQPAGVGVKSRVTHPELENPDNPEDFNLIVGRIYNARVDGDQVRADFQVSTAATPEQINRVFGLSKEMPGEIGLSAVLPDLRLERVGDKAVGRLTQVKAVDWVGAAAANPNGLLSNSAGAALAPAITSQLKGAPAMNLTEAQKQYLQGLGLDPNATDPAVIKAAIDKLTPEQKTKFDGLATPPPVTPAAAAAPVTPAIPAPSPSSAPAAAGAGAGVAAASADQGQAVALSTFRAIRDVAVLGGFDDKWVVEQYDAGRTPDQARAIALQQRQAQRAPVVLSGSPNITGGGDRNLDTLSEAVTDAILLKSRVPLYQTDTEGNLVTLSGVRQTRKPHERAAQFRHLSLVDIGRQMLTALGYSKAATLSRPEVASIVMSRTKWRGAVALSGGMSTSDFPSILADVMGKSLRQAYKLAPKTWSKWARKVTVPDFKEVKRLQLGSGSSLLALPEGSEYKFGTVTEGKEVYTLATYGRGLSFTRQMLINDDLNAFDRFPTEMGNAAGRLEEKTAYSILTANAALADTGLLFNSTALATAGGHANLTTGVLSVASIGAARAAMAKQLPLGADTTDPDFLDTQPRFLIVPEALRYTAQQLVASTVDPSKSNNTPNPVQGENLEVITCPRLDATSAIVWYLLADYNAIDTVEMAFLEGEEAPVVEEEDEFDNDTRKMKVRHNVVAKAIDFRGMVKSTGA